jgi:uncharacterized repeat protein (TIGR03803 family)
MKQSPPPRNSHFRFWTSLLTVLFVVLWNQSPDALAASKVKVLHAFKSGNDGNFPWNNLVFDASGNLYGATESGGGGGTQHCGFGGCGTVFQLSPNSNGQWTESVLHSFSYYDGADPQGELIFDSAGNLFGTAFIGGVGGDNENGTVFGLTYNSDAWTTNLLYTFCDQVKCTNGFEPRAGVVMDDAGNLYGATALGGTKGFYGLGVIFELTSGSTGWTENVLYDFCSQGTNCGNGAEPAAGLTRGSDGNLYGIAVFGGENTFPCRGGCGLVFRLVHHAASGWTYDVLHRFNGHDGANPGGLVFDRQGNLYGTTTDGGAFGFGTAFRLTPTSHGWDSTVLYNFRSHATFDPPVFDATNNLYGTTSDGGGTCRCGEVYKLSPGGRYGRWTYHSLYRFTGGDDGGFPQGGVILDDDGNLFGTTSMYGRDGYGVVFELMP